MAKGRSFVGRHVLTFLSVLLAYPAPTAFAQSISTNTPVPPLQWLKLATTGSPSPPALKDASIGYDDVTRTLIIFGGESQAGLAQSTTYLLDLDTLSWFSANAPDGLQTISPPARSAAVSGPDFAASNRHGHVVIGGKDMNGQPLSDVWEFDYNHQFWSEVNISPGSPSPRWGAAGGLDSRTAAVSAPNVEGPNNTFYLAGGVGSNGPISNDGAWELRLSGVLSSNNPNRVNGSWLQFPVKNVPGRANQSGTVFGQDVVTYGGCSSDDPALSCATQDSSNINVPAGTSTTAPPCPAPRAGASLVQNMNSLFQDQVFLLLGLFDTSLWGDGGGHNNGEVGVLDLDTEVWSRILPSGDPGTTNQPSFPSPRQGAAALSFTQALVGGNRASASDSIIFGGRDANGNYLSDIWILRAYSETLTSSGQKSTLFGDGTLRSGPNATGTGVTVQYMTACASAIAQPSSSSKRPSSTSAPSTTPTSSSTSPITTDLQSFDTSITHKIFAPLSIALILLSLLILRLSPSPLPSDRRAAVSWLPIGVGVVGYAAGIAGIITSFTSISSKTTQSLLKRASPSSHLFLRTSHGRAGIALAACLYVLLPLLYAYPLLRRWKTPARTNVRDEDADDQMPFPRLSREEGEKMATSETASPTTPTPHELGGLWPGYRPRGRHSREERTSDSARESVITNGNSVASPTTAGAQRSFEVVNRPTRGRRVSSPVLDGNHLYQPIMPRTLSDVSWLLRRRSLNTVGELDFALSQIHRTPGPPTPASTGMISVQPLMTVAAMHNSPTFPRLPSPLESVLRIFLHCTLLALCGLSLAALWMHSSKAAFAIFLLFTVIFYLAVFVLAWHGGPRESVLAVLITRLRGHHAAVPTGNALDVDPQSRPMSAMGQNASGYPFPLSNSTASHGPYLHQPPYHGTPSADEQSNAYNSVRGGAMSMETGEADDDEDEDEDARQRRMEEEMNGRDVNIITVPKRRLRITNPS